MNQTKHASRVRDAVTPVCGLVTMLAIAGCGGASSGTVYEAQSTARSLQAAHWSARAVAGMPDTFTNARQVAYLETVAPDGSAIDLQFLETSALAVAELTAARQHGFSGTTIANAIVVAHTSGTTVPPGDLDALRSLMR